MTTENESPSSETEQHVSVERNERNDKDVSLEISALRSQGLSFKEIGNKLGMSKSKAFRLANGTVQHQKDTVPEPIMHEVELDVGPISNEPPEMMSDLELNIEEKRLKREMNIKRLRAKNAWLDHVTRHPEGYYSGGNENDGHGSRETESMRDLKQEVRELKQSMQNNPLGYIKVGVDSFKSGVDSASKSQGIDPIALVQLMNQTRAEARADLESISQSHADNEFSLKKEEMRQTERLETDKLNWQKELHVEEKADTRALYGLVGQAIGADGLIGKLASGLGSVAKNRLERGGQAQIPKIIEISCPSCSKTIKALDGSPKILCQDCGAILQLQQQSMPSKPEPEATTEEPKQEQAQEQAPEPPQEQPKPKHVDVTS